MPRKKKSTTDSKTDHAKESKQQKFVRLAQKRVSKAVKVIHHIGNLGGQGYESTTEQRAKIADALTAAIESTIGRLNKEQVKPTDFQL